MDEPQKVLWRRVRIVGLALGLLCVGWLGFSYIAIEHPTTNRPERADAILVLGPELIPKVDQAVRLASIFRIDQLAISVGDAPGQSHAGLCVKPPPTITVTCFTPDPYTTRGEARALGKLANERGWTNVIVIAPKAQISRARFLIERCYHHGLQMVQADGGNGVPFSQLTYQTAALGKALLLQYTC
jgi:hypothetical protein